MASWRVPSVLEQCRVSPPAGTVPAAGKCLPLTLFDVRLLPFVVRQLLFYEFPHSREEFLHTIVPRLKHSLSLALGYYYPLAGNLMFPPDAGMPEIRCREDDSVLLVMAESSSDLGDLTGNHARNAYELEALVAEFPAAENPLLAVQVTSFPSAGICIAFRFHHVAGDGSALTSFIKCWASINLGVGPAADLLPSHDRAVVKDPTGLAAIYWNQMKPKISQSQSQHSPPSTPAERARATFVVDRTSAHKLKELVSRRFPDLPHLSTFTVTCAYTWTCIVRAKAACGPQLDDNEMEKFIFSANCRPFLSPPVPANYFGNCLLYCDANIKNAQLIGEDGFVLAAKAIGDVIYNKLHAEGRVLHDAENLISQLQRLNPERYVSVAGSPKLRLYDINFGWGTLKKTEILSTDGAISLDECAHAEQGYEMGITFPNPIIHQFASIFADGLRSLK